MKISLSNNLQLTQHIYRNREPQPGVQLRKSQKHATDFLEETKMKFHYPAFQKKTKPQTEYFIKIIIFGHTSLRASGYSSPATGRHLPLDQVAHFQWWGIHNFCGQSVPMNSICNIIINPASTLHALLGLTVKDTNAA